MIMNAKSFLTFLMLSILLFTSSYGQLHSVMYNDGNQKLNGISSKPKNIKRKKQGILILPAWMGIDDHSKNIAKQLNALGYYTFIADIYGESNYPKNQKEAGERSSLFKNNSELYTRRIKLALDQLIKSGADPQKIVVIGYCFGGTGALYAARANLNVKGVVSFHGGLARDTSINVNPIKTKILVCHGASDPFVPEAQIKDFHSEMKQSGADWQMIYYADAVHAFTDPSVGNDPSKGAAYNEKAAKRSWQHMLQFFNELL
jgi:dienelactone hydrolase